jgi:hypothetical protein
MRGATGLRLEPAIHGNPNLKPPTALRVTEGDQARAPSWSGGDLRATRSATALSGSCSNPAAAVSECQPRRGSCALQVFPIRRVPTPSDPGGSLHPRLVFFAPVPAREASRRSSWRPRQGVCARVLASAPKSRRGMPGAARISFKKKSAPMLLVVFYVPVTALGIPRNLAASMPYCFILRCKVL